MLSLFMHSIIPHHHHDHDECEVFDINGFTDVLSFVGDSHKHIHNSLDHEVEEHSESDCHSDHHSYLSCHFHSDITVISVLDFNFLLPEGIKIIAFKVENDVAYYLEPEIYNFSPEEHKFRRGPPTSFMG